jgi:hypothetical protein
VYHFSNSGSVSSPAIVWSSDATKTVVGVADVMSGAAENSLKFVGIAEDSVKGFKATCKGALAVTAVIDTVELTYAYNDPKFDARANKALLDVSVGVIAVWGGPVGWGVGATYFV